MIKWVDDYNTIVTLLFQDIMIIIIISLTLDIANLLQFTTD